MKNIKLSIFIIAQLFVAQLVTGQTQTDENGRELGSAPAQVADTKASAPSSTDDLSQIDDADIPGTYYLGGGGESDVILGGEAPADLLNWLDNMEAELQELRSYNEQLAHENETMKLEMSNCCAEAAANIDIASSYLMQNSPNPFQAGTIIQYFIAAGAENAQLELRDMDGKLLKVFDLDETGMGKLNVDRKAFKKGSYVYTLSVDGKIIDSKVMILQ